MPHDDYLGDLPQIVKEALTAITGDMGPDWQLIHRFADLAEDQIEKRYEISLSLLNAIDLIEIAVQRSMVPTQKAEFAWKIYMRYFQVLAKLLERAAREPGGDAIEGTLPHLIMKMKYELKRREPVIAKGGADELEKILQPIRHLL